MVRKEERREETLDNVRKVDFKFRTFKLESSTTSSTHLLINEFFFCLSRITHVNKYRLICNFPTKSKIFTIGLFQNKSADP